MLNKIYVLVIIYLFSTYFAYSQDQNNGVQSRVLILLDESSSMIRKWQDGTPKHKAAGKLILELMDSVYKINPQIEFSLRAFGEQSEVKDNNCYDTKNEVPFSRENKTQMSLRLDDLRPLGITPIAYSLKQAGENDLLDEAHNAYSLVLITDGGESCNGDICGVMHDLMKSKIFFKPYIVGLEEDPTLDGIYACMGNYLKTTKTTEITTTVSTIVRGLFPALKINKAGFTDVRAEVKYGPPMQRMNYYFLNNYVMRNFGPVESLRYVRYSGEDIVFKVKIDSSTLVRTVSGTQFSSLTQSTYHSFSTQSFSLTAFANINQRSLPAMPPFVKMDTELLVRAVGAPIQTIKLSPLKLFAMEIFKLMANTKLTVRNLPELPAFVRSDTLVPPPPLSKLAKSMSESSSYSTDFKMEVLDAKETGLEIYFTNGKGSYYQSQPIVLMIDAGTTNVVKQFKRTVDGLGNIDVQNGVMTGTYDIAFASKKGLWVHNVVIKDKKLNRLVVNVKNTKLKFVYEDAPSRPVSEFKAVVKQLNKSPIKISEQRCNELIEYEPGVYQIDINTFPRQSIKMDLDFEQETIINLKQPGFGHFNGSGLQKHFVELYQKVDGVDIKYYTLDVNDPESKHLRIQPGNYEVHYTKDNERVAKPTILVKPFTINPESETIVDLL